MLVHFLIYIFFKPCDSSWGAVLGGMCVLCCAPVPAQAGGVLCCCTVGAASEMSVPLSLCVRVGGSFVCCSLLREMRRLGLVYLKLQFSCSIHTFWGKKMCK